MKTSIKKANGEGPYITVTPKAYGLLPEALIEYLIGLAGKDAGAAGTERYFSLRPEKTSGREILEITYTDENGKSESHRVFGCGAVDADICLRCEGSVLIMAVLDEDLSTGRVLHENGALYACRCA